MPKIIGINYDGVMLCNCYVVLHVGFQVAKLNNQSDEEKTFHTLLHIILHGNNPLDSLDVYKNY